MTSIKTVSYTHLDVYKRQIPDKVISELSDRLGELDEMNRLVFQIFSETGMRAKEVAFLEADCLETARYEGAVKLKYIPYKILKARRRNGIGEHHTVYISAELAEKIKKQIASSEEFRRKHDLPYIFLHQNEGYKAVSYTHLDVYKRQPSFHVQKDTFRRLWPGSETPYYAGILCPELRLL